MTRPIVFPIAVVLAVVAPASLSSAEPTLSFKNDVLPILASNCFACHGPDADAREAELRLDTREGATRDLSGSRAGSRAIVPGQPNASELYRRLVSEDADARMPPAETGKMLTMAEIETVRQWISDGAEYETHWAFTSPTRPVLPLVKNTAWPRTPIDHFVFGRLEAEGLSPSPEADRYSLVRRVHLDLIGLPPSPAAADAFVQDTDPRAYENLVDRLLESPHYGERWARRWLDLARYADTNGYEKDRIRSVWPYRDWVLRALNGDMPFDQFTIEQLAGDMLPGATVDQRIATGFHRNTMLNEEGGIDPLEYRFYAMVDRVATTGTVWLGLTTGCAQCHTHKYDPISQTEYYRIMALLNNADEPDLVVPDFDVARRRAEIETEIARLEADLPAHFPPASGGEPVPELRQRHLTEKFDAWVDAQQPRAVTWKVLRPREVSSNLPKLEVLADGSVFSSGDITKRDVYTLKFDLAALDEAITALRLEVLPDARLPSGGPGRSYYEGRKGEFFLSEVTAAVDGTKVGFASASHSYAKLSFGRDGGKADNVIDGEGSTGWATAEREGQASQLVLNLAEPLAASGELEITLLFERHFAASLGRFRFDVTLSPDNPEAKKMPAGVEAMLARNRTLWSVAEAASVRRYYLSVAEELADARKPIDALRGQLPELPITLVMDERPSDHPRQTFRHHRGEYLSPKEEVTPGLPVALSPGSKSRPRDRLEFARWLVDGENPLVGRVTVNRAWQAFFGTGLVRTVGDFGTQGDAPTHPELLDWLALEFVHQGWSMKRLHRLIVLSAAYRQSSRVTPELWQRDPDNRLLARGPRLRVDAETVRDMMLEASGRLSTRIGGPSVFPPQPESVTALSYGAFAWTVSEGADRYRRSLYTFSKRTAPFAAYAVYDAPSGESCVPRRDRSNTPLQALTLLNDDMFVELARELGKTASSMEASSGERATWIFRRCATRPPTHDEVDALVEFQEAQRRRFESGELDAAAIGDVENASPDLATWVMVARAIMNLDETVTKQ